MIYEDTMCCGVKEAAGLNKAETPREAMKQLILSYISDGGEFAHVIFTEARKTRKSTGHLGGSWWGRLASYIKRYSLGQITSGPWKINPNTKNSVRVHVFTPNISTLKKMFAKEVAKEEKRRKYEIDYWTRW